MFFPLIKKYIGLVLFAGLCCNLLSGCATKKIKDLPYGSFAGLNSPQLNVFVPRQTMSEKMPVLIFIHGGNWNSGNKDSYGFYGRNFSKKKVVTVIPDYTLSPAASYEVMTKQVAATIVWVKTHIADYGGDPNRIFVTGHSAGGHLAALAVMNPKYGIDPKSIAGIILNDAAGLDINHYLIENPPTDSNDYLTTWTSDPNNWKAASPIYFLNKDTPPFMVYVGDKTYQSIKVANSRFLAALKPFQPQVKPIRLNKTHIPMVLQYFFPWSYRFDETIHFMKNK